MLGTKYRKLVFHFKQIQKLKSIIRENNCVYLKSLFKTKEIFKWYFTNTKLWITWMCSVSEQVSDS